MTTARPLTGSSAIALAIVFNIPYAILAATYDYPDVLRRPAGAAPDLFAARGVELILTWHGFALAALALAPMAIALSLTPGRVAERPGLAIGAAIMGSLAGLAQAIGLWRWVFVIPGLARTHADPAASPEARDDVPACVKPGRSRSVQAANARLCLTRGELGPSH
jgi:hypothetical protein